MSIFDINKDGVVDWKDAGDFGKNLFGFGNNASGATNANQTGGLFGSSGANLLAALGGIASADSAADRIEGLGDTATTTLDALRTKLETDTDFDPFSVTAGPGKVEFDASGGSKYTLDSPFDAIRTDLAGAGNYGYNTVFGKTVDPDTGEVSFNPTKERNALIDLLKSPFGGTVNPVTGQVDRSDRDAREQSVYDRLREIRTPQEERAQMQTDNKLFNQGRSGLQTAAYGGSPEQFALSQAIEEQKSRDALTAMGFARDDAAMESSAIARALGLEVDQKQLGVNASSQALRDSLLGDSFLSSLTNPSINVADLISTNNRQMAGYERDLVSNMLDYDLGTEELATVLRQQGLSSLLDFLATGDYKSDLSAILGGS